MAGLDFKSSVQKEQEDQAIVAYNTRIGLGLFFVYFVIYGGFMALSAFKPKLMKAPFLAGVNLSVVYGFALIVAAIVLAILYARLCRKSTPTSSR